jgi:hypothetical protein
MITTDFGSPGFSNEVIKWLNRYGKAAPQYITSALLPGPWSGAQPDIVFVPATGIYRGHVHVIETMRTASPILPDVSLMELARHASLIRRVNDRPIRFGILINPKVSSRQSALMSSIEQISAGPVELLDGVRNSHIATQRILEWTQVPHNQG